MDRCVVDLPTDMSGVPVAQFGLSVDVDSGDIDDDIFGSLDREESSSRRYELVAGDFEEKCDRTRLVLGLWPTPR